MRHLIALATLGSALAAASACTKKKKDDGAPPIVAASTSPQVPLPEASGTPSPASTGTPIANNDNVTTGGAIPPGTTGSGSLLPRAELGLSPAAVPSSTQPNLEAELEDLSRDVHLFELSPRAPRSLALSDLESKTEVCVRSGLEATRFEANAQGFKLVTNFDFKKCIEDAKPGASPGFATRKWNAGVQWAMRARCDNHDFTPFHQKALTNADTLRYLCYNSTGGELYAHVKFNAEELDVAGKTLRSYVRTRALSGKQKDTCNFTLEGGKRKYDDCVWVDGTKNQNGVLRHVEVGLGAASQGQFDSAGQKYAGGKVAVRYNNWQGDVDFGADPSVKGSWALSNGQTQAKGTNNFPWPAEYELTSQVYKDPVQQQGTSQQQQQSQQQQSQ